MLEVNSIYLYRNKKQIFSDFSLFLKKKTDNSPNWRKWSW